VQAQQQMIQHSAKQEKKELKTKEKEKPAD
jgi:hypothetical protein